MLDLPDDTPYSMLHRKLRAADSRGEISTVNRTFATSLKQRGLSVDASSQQIHQLDKANIYTWLAYCLYDRVLDNNENEALSFANIFMRKAIELYSEVGVPPELIQRLFLEVDKANAVELSLRAIAHTNAPLDPSKFEPLLSAKSIAHCLGQIWTVTRLDIPETPNIIEAFYEYCAARQLCDDIYDWRDDFACGHHTFVTATLLQSTPAVYPNTKTSDSLMHLNKTFSATALETVCTHVVSLATSSIAKLSPIIENDSPYCAHFIQPLADSAHASIDTHRQRIATDTPTSVL